jgi:hypothetical protein
VKIIIIIISIIAARHRVMRRRRDATMNEICCDGDMPRSGLEKEDEDATISRRRRYAMVVDGGDMPGGRRV